MRADCVRGMPSFESWLHPLRAYPSGFVLACFALSVGGLLWGISKLLKWSVYVVAMSVFVALNTMFAFWLWM